MPPPSSTTRRDGSEISWTDGLALPLLSSIRSKSLAITRSPPAQLRFANAAIAAYNGGRRSSCLAPLSVDGDGVAGAPALVEPRLERAEEAHDDEVAATGPCLHPVALASFGRFRAEPDGVAAIRVGGEAFPVAVDAGGALVGLEQGTGLVVVDGEGPEVSGWDRARQGEAVGPAAIQVVAVGVAREIGIDRACADLWRNHRFRVASHAVVPARPVIERQGAFHHEVPGPD